jgi:hypothetical protein
MLTQQLTATVVVVTLPAAYRVKAAMLRVAMQVTLSQTLPQQQALPCLRQTSQTSAMPLLQVMLLLPLPTMTCMQCRPSWLVLLQGMTWCLWVAQPAALLRPWPTCRC